MRTLTLRYIARTGGSWGSWGPGNVAMCLRWCLGCSSGHWLRIIKLFIMTQARCPSCHTVSPMFCIIFSHLPPPPHKLGTKNWAFFIDQIQTKLKCWAPGAKWGGWWVQRIMNIKLCDCRIAVIVLIIVDQGEYKWNMFCTPARSRKLILPHNLSDSKHWESERSGLHATLYSTCRASLGIVGQFSCCNWGRSRWWLGATSIRHLI